MEQHPHNEQKVFNTTNRDKENFSNKRKGKGKHKKWNRKNSAKLRHECFWLLWLYRLRAFPRRAVCLDLKCVYTPSSVKKLVHTSSVHAIPEKSHGETITEVSEFDPKSVHGLYAKTKAAASQIVLNAVKQGLNASIVHPSGIIGPGDYGRTHLTQLVISYLNGTLTACVNGGYDFVDVRDVADGIISCVENGRAGECYILSNQFYTIQEVLDDLHEITGKRRLKSVLPLWFAKLTAPLAEVWYKMLRQPPLYTSYSLYTLESNGNFSHEKATQELGYHPRSMKDTLTDMAYWLESYNRIKFKFKTAHAV